MNGTQMKIITRFAQAMESDPTADFKDLVSTVSFAMTREAITLGWSDDAINRIPGAVFDTCYEITMQAIEVAA